MPRAPMLLAALALGGCYFTQSPIRPVPALTFLREGGARQSCLVIFLPGFLDGSDTFREQLFPDDVLSSGARCDSVAVDAHFRYYVDRGVADVLHEDVLAPAVARGYTEIWLVGTSMGGLGALLLARDHTDLIDGIVLLSPFLGEPRVVRSIEEAGGLSSWHPPDPLPREMNDLTYTIHLWAWLRGYVDDPDGRPALYIGWADGESFAGTNGMLAAALPEGHVVSAPGEHGWRTWRPLFDRLLTVARPGR